ncbi:MAG: hypothetical protein NVS3B10_26720 [Polyangiales bacterium]
MMTSSKPSRLRSVAATLVVVHTLSAALSAATVAAVVGSAPTARAAEVVITEEARQHFSAGVALLKDPDGAKYEDAYREFKAAFTASPSWKILGNLGLCAMKLERDGEAIEAYDRYVSEGGAAIDPGEKKQVETDLRTLKVGVATVKLTVDPANVIVEDSRIPTKGGAINNVYGPVSGSVELKLHPGHHVVQAKLAGYDTQSWEVEAGPGANQTHDFALKPQTVATTTTGTGTTTTTTSTQPEPPARPTPGIVYVGLAATGVLLVGGGVVGFMAKGKKSDFDAKNGVDSAEAQTLKSDGEKFNHIADAMFAGAVVVGTVSAILYFTRPTVGQPSGTSDVATLRVVPAVTPSGGGLVLSGAF